MLSGLIVRAFALCGVSLAPVWAGVVLSAIAAGGVGFGAIKVYDAGYASAEGKCEAAALQSQLDAVVADRDNARKAASDATLKLAAIEQQSQDDQERTAAYVKELETRPVPTCALTDDDLRGLRSPARAGHPRARAPARAHLLEPGKGAAAKAR